MAVTEQLLAKGLGASPGKATGPAAFSNDAAIAFAAKGTPAILFRTDAGAEDVAGVKAAAALVTTHGGITGDGAIIARALGKPCLTGCTDVKLFPSDKKLIVRDATVNEGELVTVDATNGAILLG